MARLSVMVTVIMWAFSFASSLHYLPFLQQVVASTPSDGQTFILTDGARVDITCPSTTTQDFIIMVDDGVFVNVSDATDVLLVSFLRQDNDGKNGSCVFPTCWQSIVTPTMDAAFQLSPSYQVYYPGMYLIKVQNTATRPVSFSIEAAIGGELPYFTVGLNTTIAMRGGEWRSYQVSMPSPTQVMVCFEVGINSEFYLFLNDNPIVPNNSSMTYSTRGEEVPLKRTNASQMLCGSLTGGMLTAPSGRLYFSVYAGVSGVYELSVQADPNSDVVAMWLIYKIICASLGGILVICLVLFFSVWRWRVKERRDEGGEGMREGDGGGGRQEGERESDERVSLLRRGRSDDDMLHVPEAMGPLAGGLLPYSNSQFSILSD